ncbi:sodium/potassium-transporting ATPase subunit alpha [Geosmithia morbida]|uniref:Sodium/potassium-transporting ATPase subunit alpha n=1 Tax=Geosmithia morbida TaxID=1094350 RepID=A0A9P5D278_9HYPO|nr:sodium/potassium-transporting ATPase subunit alpha [Geosmithia morbida]KAF4124728.1 sodium/potassium-transporting ATPase subunit alpha [Geosmithia morbida]
MNPTADKEVLIERIRFQDDEERGRPRRTSRERPGRAISSDSINSVRTRAHSRDAALALPIQYRTIEESKGKDRAEAQKAKVDAAKDLTDLEWHTIGADQVAQRLRTSPTAGLETEQIKKRQAEYGRNAPSPAQTRWFSTVMGYFFKGFGSVLLVASILVFISWKPLGDPPAVANLALAIVLLAVFVIQALFNMFQDWSTTRVMSSIKHMLPEECEVIREGVVVRPPASEIVPGDLVRAKSGDKLPADMRFVQVSSDAKFDRSVLTGESRPVPATVDHTDTNYLETFNIGLQGTHCTVGSCMGIVVATGDRTVFGRIAKLTSEPETKMTTLERELMYFVIFICCVMFTMAAIAVTVWGAWLHKDHPDFINVPTLIVSLVSVTVAFMPEGLPVALTAGLTITANLMRKEKILCKSLKTVETLGSVSVVCSDKTGTLTEGTMTVTEAVVGLNSMSVDDAASAPRESGSSLRQLRAMSALCNAGEMDAATSSLPLTERRIFGDATDQAILRFAEAVESGGVAYLRACWSMTFELGFNSKNKFMIRCFSIAKTECLPQTLSRLEAGTFGDKDMLLTIKGAPDVIVDRCTQYVTATGDMAPIDKSIKMRIDYLKNRYSSQGKRCLLLARKVVPLDQVCGEPRTTEQEASILEHSRSGLVLVGLVAIVDPLRPEIPDVVRTLRGAGIRVAMVTGDFALTALAIARDAGIVTSETVDGPSDLRRTPDDEDLKSTAAAPQIIRHPGAIVLSGPDLISLTEYQWSTLTRYREVVFARTTPEQKLRIVREFQNENVVAMTGDGVNDAPSLKAADVGVALGSGSDIAIEAADMILLDSFSSFLSAVQYGRVVFDNLKKVICYLLPAGSFSEFWPIMTNILFGLPQILSCFTDCIAATMLSYEKPEADVLLRPPRNVEKDRLVNWQLILHSYGLIGIIQTLASFAMSYWYLQRKGIPFKELWFGFGEIPPGIDEEYYTRKLSEASSIYFVNLVVMQWFNLMTTRTRRLSIFQHPPLFNRRTQNWYLFPAILFALAMAIMWLYIPQLYPILGTTPVPVEHWFLPFAFGIFLIVLDEARKFLVAKFPGSWLAKAAW